MGAPARLSGAITQPGKNPPVGPSLPAALKHSGAGARHLTCGAQALRANRARGIATGRYLRGGGKSSAGWGNISDAAPRLGPARPARFNLIRVSGQQDVTRPRSPRSGFGSGWFGFRGGNLACARNRRESGKGVAGKEQRRVWPPLGPSGWTHRWQHGSARVGSPAAR